ncbi:uncharacterized protein [Tiliqua scincoides]|uniref:uncharacterized protein isoform X2 n=1 Tax=Tiliqua scincoides TaxID=71010 RepID=UPI003462F32F
MDKRTYHDHLQYLVVFIVVQSLQATDYPPLGNHDLPITMATDEARNATVSSSGMPTVSIKGGGNITTLYNADVNWSTYTESNSPSDTAAETKTEVTTPLATKSFFNTSAHQASTEDDSKVTTSAIAWKLMTQPSQTPLLFSSKVLFSSSASQFPGARLKDSETILTIGFAIILALTILGFIVYLLNRYRKRRDQYSHHPLYNASSEIVDRYATPDDTLIISGGLYDAPRTYNPSLMVYEDEDLQIDHLPFSAQHGQYRLEFLPGEKEKSPSSTYETFQIPPGEL